MDTTMLELGLFSGHTLVGVVVLGVIAVALVARYFIRKRIRKNHMASYLNADFSIACIPRDSENK